MIKKSHGSNVGATWYILRRHIVLSTKELIKSYVLFIVASSCNGDFPERLLFFDLKQQLKMNKQEQVSFRLSRISQICIRHVIARSTGDTFIP